MRYLTFEHDEDFALDQWKKSQYDLCDVVLSLTDNKIIYGAKIYAIFLREEVLNLMHYFTCDFKKMKRELGLCGNYVERCGNVYSKDFNPKRNVKCLTLTVEEMKKISKNIYQNIMKDLSEIVEKLN